MKEIISYTYEKTEKGDILKAKTITTDYGISSYTVSDYTKKAIIWWVIALMFGILTIISFTGCSSSKDKGKETVIPNNVPTDTVKKEETKYTIFRSDFLQEEVKTIEELQEMKVLNTKNTADILGVIQKNLNMPLYLTDLDCNVMEYQSYPSRLNVVIKLDKDTDIEPLLPLMIKGKAFRFDADIGSHITDSYLGGLETDEYSYYVTYRRYKDGYIIEDISNRSTEEYWSFLKDTYDDRVAWYKEMYVVNDNGEVISACACGCDECETEADCDQNCEDEEVIETNEENTEEIIENNLSE